MQVISSVIYGPASPTLDRMRASETLAPLVAPCDCFAISSCTAGVDTSYDFAALDARSARSVVIVLALLKSGRTFSGMLLWHGAQMRLRSIACGLGPQTFSTGPASSVLQLRARERALAQVRGSPIPIVAQTFGQVWIHKSMSEFVDQDLMCSGASRDGGDDGVRNHGRGRRRPTARPAALHSLTAGRCDGRHGRQREW